MSLLACPATSGYANADSNIIIVSAVPVSFLACPATSGYVYADSNIIIVSAVPVSFLACPATSGYVYADSNIIIVSAIQYLFLPVQLLLAMFALRLGCLLSDERHYTYTEYRTISHITY